MDNNEERKKKLLDILKEEEWPQLYMFKFIVTNSDKKIKEVKAAQSNNANISIKTSKNGKFASITVKETMLNADGVIERYEVVGKIEGVMSL